MHSTLKVQSMETRAEKAQDNKKNRSAAYQAYQRKSSADAGHLLVDYRRQAQQQKLRDMANNSARVSQLMAFQVMANKREPPRNPGRFSPEIAPVTA